MLETQTACNLNLNHFRRFCIESILLDRIFFLFSVLATFLPWSWLSWGLLDCNKQLAQLHGCYKDESYLRSWHNSGLSIQFFQSFVQKNVCTGHKCMWAHFDACAHVFASTHVRARFCFVSVHLCTYLYQHFLLVHYSVMNLSFKFYKDPSFHPN